MDHAICQERFNLYTPFQPHLLLFHKIVQEKRCTCHDLEMSKLYFHLDIQNISENKIVILLSLSDEVVVFIPVFVSQMSFHPQLKSGDIL